MQLALVLSSLAFVPSVIALNSSSLNDTTTGGLDCSQCHDEYKQCMTACINHDPAVSGKYAQCQEVCFCAVAEKHDHDCGVKCGFEVGCPAKQADEEHPHSANSNALDDDVTLGSRSTTELTSSDDDCQDCVNLYLACIDVCTSFNPPAPQRFQYCNEVCFCDVARSGNQACGGACGYAGQCPDARFTSPFSQVVTNTTLNESLPLQNEPRKRDDTTSDYKTVHGVATSQGGQALPTGMKQSSIEAGALRSSRRSSPASSTLTTKAGRQEDHFSQCRSCGEWIQNCADKTGLQGPLDVALCVCSHGPGYGCEEGCFELQQDCIGGVLASLPSSKTARADITVETSKTLTERQKSPPCRDCAAIVDGCASVWCPQKKLLEAIFCVCGTVDPRGCEQSCWAGYGGCLSGAAEMFNGCGSFQAEAVNQLQPRHNPTIEGSPGITITADRCAHCGWKFTFCRSYCRLSVGKSDANCFDHCVCSQEAGGLPCPTDCYKPQICPSA